MRNAPRAAILPVAVTTLVLGLLNIALLMPGLRPAEYSKVIDIWLNMVVDAGVIAVVLLRATVERRERVPWLLLGLGLMAAFVGSAAYLLYYEQLDPVPFPVLTVAGYLTFYALLYVGLLLRLRQRVRRMLRSVWLDGLIAGLTAVALATAYIDGARVPWIGPVSGDGWRELYPLGDLLLLALGVAALAILGRTAGPSWCLLCLSFITFAITDSVHAQLRAEGTYSPGDPLDAGWLLARLLLGAAAVVSLRTRSQQRDLDGASVLVLPGVCALAVLGLLYDHPDSPLTAGATAIAAGAGAAMVLRTAFTFHELRALTEGKQRALMGRLVQAQDDTRARIAGDVHDDSLQALAAVDLRLGALRRRLEQRSPEEVPGVETTIASVHEAAVRLRHLLFELETPALEQDLPDALREAAEHLFADSGVTWIVEQMGDGELPTITRVSAYRIAREAMVNVLKHAQASSLRVTVDVQERGVQVSIVDDGLGVDATTATPSRRRHSGVVGMRDRAVASGGWWRSEPGKGGVGTQVVFFLPRAAQAPQMVQDEIVVAGTSLRPAQRAGSETPGTATSDGPPLAPLLPGHSKLTASEGR